MLGWQVLEELLRPNSVDEAFSQVSQHAQLLIHVLHLGRGCSCHLTCTWAAGVTVAVVTYVQQLILLLHMHIMLGRLSSDAPQGILH